MLPLYTQFRYNSGRNVAITYTTISLSLTLSLIVAVGWSSTYTGQLLRNDIRRDAVWLTGSSSGGSRLSGNSEFGNKVGKEERRRQARQVPPMEPHIVRVIALFLFLSF